MAAPLRRRSNGHRPHDHTERPRVHGDRRHTGSVQRHECDWRRPAVAAVCDVSRDDDGIPAGQLGLAARVELPVDGTLEAGRERATGEGQSQHDCLVAGAGVSRRQPGPQRNGRPALRVHHQSGIPRQRDHGRRPADGDCRAGAAGGMRQRREPAARTSGGAKTGDCGPLVAGGWPPAADSATAHRERRARPAGRCAGPAARRLVTIGASGAAAAVPAGGRARGAIRCAGADLHRGHRARHGPSVRSRTRAPVLTAGSRHRAEGPYEPAVRHAQSYDAARRARDRAGCAVVCRPHRRRALPA